VLAVGGRADLALLSTDVFAAAAAPPRVPLGDVRVELTVAAGRVVHDVT